MSSVTLGKSSVGRLVNEISFKVLMRRCIFRQNN
jgi:hypothetical protein